MITELRLTNFQGFRESISIPFAPITVVFGPNSSGKSSVFRSLLFLKQTNQHFREARVATFSGEHVDLGSFKTCVWGHEVNRQIQVGFTTDRGQSIDLSFGFDGALKRTTLSGLWGISAATRARRKNNGDRAKQGDLEPIQLAVSSGDVSDSHWQITNLDDLDKNSKLLQDFLEYAVELKSDVPSEQLLIEAKECLARLQFAPRSGLFLEPNSPPIVDNDGKLRTTVADMYFESLFTVNNRVLEEQLRHLSHLAGIRVVPERFSTLGRSSRISPDGSNLIDTFNRDSRLVERSSDWIHRVSQGRYRLELIPFKSDELGFLGEVGTLALRDVKLNMLTTFRDVGTGLSQVIPIIAALAKVSLQPTLPGPERLIARMRGFATAPAMFEQPELHLHPRMQAELADLFIDSSCVKHRTYPQVLLETHSENLILRLQRRVREGQIKASDISIVYVSKDIDSGTSTIQPLELDVNGDFKNDWDAATEFSELRLREMF